jgi:hypothetical protein
MSNRQFREADAAIERAVGKFIGAIERIEGRFDSVSPAYVVEAMLIELCEKLTKKIDTPNMADIVLGPAEIKLSNALADYRDSRFVDRGAPLAAL